MEISFLKTAQKDTTVRLKKRARENKNTDKRMSE